MSVPSDGSRVFLGTISLFFIVLTGYCPLLSTAILLVRGNRLGLHLVGISGFSWQQGPSAHRLLANNPSSRLDLFETKFPSNLSDVTSAS